MIYLKGIVSKITNNKEIIETVRSMDSDEKILNYLKSNGIQHKDIISILEKHYGFNYLNLNDYEINSQLLNQFEIDVLEKQLVLPYKEDINGKVFYFVTNNITNQSIVKNITDSCKAKNYKPVINFSFEHEILNKYKQIVPDSMNILEHEFDVQSWVNEIINEGIKLRASDIHIEKLENDLQIRYRIDGLLVNKKTFSFNDSILSSIAVRIKIISDMDMSEKRKPQDGRIESYVYESNKYDIRVSSVSTIFGEKFVMRIIPKSSEIKSFFNLGFNEKDTLLIKKMLENKNGIIYLGGATGSGKSTTLYTMIDHINSDNINIYTIENPVEKTIKNVNQIQINHLAGIDYASILKSLLRQDPDVIVVGEIRDVETANLSVRASLTGHLVLSTIHANNALDSISRLLDMNIEPYLLSASSIGFLSQRLVRVLCPYCKKQVDVLKPYERAWLDKMTNEYELNHYDDNQFYKAVGCPHCLNGYKDRIAVIEVLEANDNIKSLISTSRDLKEIRAEALKNGFKPLTVNGIEKALNGTTTIDELIRQIN